MVVLKGWKDSDAPPFEIAETVMAEHSFYAVGHGKNQVYMKSGQMYKSRLIKDFPQPVYKKFATKEEAEEYVKARQPEKISLEVDEKADKFYAVARGKVVGIFTDYNEVKNHIADYPQPLYKKFEKLDEAKAYYKKYSNGEKDGNLKESKAHNTPADNNEKEIKETENTGEKKEQTNKEQVFYAVAHGHKTGVFKTWEECQEATKDFKSAHFKEFDNEGDAKLFVESRNIKEAEDRKRAHSPDDVADGVEEKSAKKKIKQMPEKRKFLYLTF
ncbi:SNF7 family protein [Dirofilaria immitis]|nr:SNF7 family protein [Dirofilaria immitis]